MWPFNDHLLNSFIHTHALRSFDANQSLNWANFCLRVANLKVYVNCSGRLLGKKPAGIFYVFIRAQDIVI